MKEKQCSSLFPSSFLALTSFTVFEEEGVSVSQFVILSVCLFVSHFVCLSVSLSVCRNIKFTNLFRNDKMTFYTFDFDFSVKMIFFLNLKSLMFSFIVFAAGATLCDHFIPNYY